MPILSANLVTIHVPHVLQLQPSALHAQQVLIEVLSLLELVLAIQDIMITVLQCVHNATIHALLAQLLVIAQIVALQIIDNSPSIAYIPINITAHVILDTMMSVVLQPVKDVQRLVRHAHQAQHVVHVLVVPHVMLQSVIPLHSIEQLVALINVSAHQDTISILHQAPALLVIANVKNAQATMSVSLVTLQLLTEHSIALIINVNV